MESALPPIPAKRYFTIGEVGDLCGVKPHVLRYWEQEFTQLRPMKRRGNRRYYQHHEVLMIRRIRELLYDQGFTISGARTRLQELESGVRGALAATAVATSGVRAGAHDQPNETLASLANGPVDDLTPTATAVAPSWRDLSQELSEIRDLLTIG
ncbi:MerR family transcriptional regulator [Ottowia oryzae]|uniref:MerR family transcriptional regulator n=1 Tax=Ottowia oryzae TaxID=2109914 RepID=A0A2S0MJY2_9BURK|nr:MerR family transcriptional regulator [Ottowia oryzae]AVO36061.1 MerR family transcriptional regulator [Ottowia oryzae]